MKKPKIGITGATGFIGRNLIEKLLVEKYSVKALVIEKKPNLPKKVETVHGNLVTAKGLSEFLKEVDVVIHLAARIMPPEEKMIRDNTVATHNLVTEALKHPIKQVIFTSSVSVYGKDKKRKFKETDECFPNTHYGLSKYLAEKSILFWSTITGKTATIFRPFNIYGPKNLKGIIYAFYSDIKETGGVIIYGDGKQERDFLYVDDLVDLLIRAVRVKKRGIFNIGVDKKHSVLGFLSIYRKIMKDDLKVKYSPNEQGKVFNINQDLSKVKREFGWRARTSLKDGLKKTIAWYEKKLQ